MSIDRLTVRVYGSFWQAGGDAYTLIQLKKECGFRDAVQWAIEHKLISGNGTSTRQIETEETRLLHSILTEAAVFFHKNLPDNQRKHLKEHYGLSDETIDEYRLGFAPVDELALVNHLKVKFKLEDIRKTGLLTKWGKSHFQGQLVFPYWHRGLVKYFIARRTPESPKWKQGKYDKLPVHDPKDRAFISPEIQNAYFYGEDSIVGKDTVFVAEGVTDCLGALQYCLPSISPVTTSFREQDWLKLAQLCKGKTVYLVPDNEVNEAGFKGAEKTRIHLEAKGIECHTIVLPRPESKDKIDLNEYLRDNGINAFHGLVKACLPPSIDDVILESSEYVRLDIPDKRTFLHPWCADQSIIQVDGWRGVGKTWFVLYVLDAITRRQAFGPWECRESVPCLYLDGEMAASDVKRRIEMMPAGPRENPLYIYSDAYASTRGVGRASLLDEKWRNAIKGILLKRNVKVWVVDNLASLTSGIDENSKQEYDPINCFFLDLRFNGITTIVLHHQGKGGQQRGTSAREDNIDVSISLQTPQNYVPEEGARFIVHFSKHRIDTRDLPLIADTELWIKSGTYEHVDVRKQAKKQILRLIDEGLSQTDITKTLTVDKAYVSRVKTQAIKDGLLSTKNKLTQTGFSAVYGQ